MQLNGFLFLTRILLERDRLLVGEIILEVFLLVSNEDSARRETARLTVNYLSVTATGNPHSTFDRLDFIYSFRNATAFSRYQQVAVN